MLMLNLILLKSIFMVVSFGFEFEDKTNETFSIGERSSGLIAAFGHFNSDEFTDIVIVKKNGKKLQILVGSDKQPYFQDPSSGPLNCTFSNVITSVVPADFNGDSVLDMLITLQFNENLHEVKILWGENESIDCKADTILQLLNQPIIMDFNGDMIPDIIGQNEQGERYVWIASERKTFHNITFPSIIDQTFAVNHSSGLIDINHDMAPDMLIMGKNYIEVWLYTGKSFVKNDSYRIDYPTNMVRTGQATFLDINLDEKLDIILPVCYDASCMKSAVLVWNGNLSKWDVLFKNFVNPNDKDVWGFTLPLGSPLEMNALLFTLRSGDIDLDGYPDFITVLQAKHTPGHVQGVILKNVPCDGCPIGRTLQIDWSVPGLKDVQNIQLAAFFDVYEDGALDILAVSKDNKKEWNIHALINTEVIESCFLKVLVLNGLSLNSFRPYGALPYGVNQPGPMVKYNITLHDGRPLTSTSIQLSQSAFFPLHLPYSLFGLGPTPNFIDILTVSIPAEFNQTVHMREWTQIIPNSQIVVIPLPPNEEKQWRKKLFVTPSHLVLLTLISLIGTCIFLSLLVALLHWNERREDKKEKKQDAHRFHFDAM